MFALELNGQIWFFHNDPRADGFDGQVEVIILRNDPADDIDCKDGQAAPEQLLGKREVNLPEYRFFRSRQDLLAKRRL